MSQMQQFFGEHFTMILALIALAIALTLFVFRKRWFDRGYRKGDAANPERVKRQNPPDEWSKSH
ncbi:MAG: hypothetical protein ACREV5_17670 [Steroidobacter sp.]